MNWLRNNLFFAVLLIVFLVLLAGGIMLQRRAAAEHDEVARELEEQQTRLKRITSVKPFPSGQNLKKLRYDRQELEAHYVTLQQAAGVTVTVPDLTDVEFVGRMATTLKKLREISLLGGVYIHEDFAFGFDRYMGVLPARGLEPEEAREVLSLLTKQLMVIDKLTRLLVEHQIEQIHAITRVDVEPGGQHTPDSLQVTMTEEQASLYQVLPFELTFACTTPSLRAVLNALSQADWFFAVKNLSISVESLQEKLESPDPEGLEREMMMEEYLGRRLPSRSGQPRPGRPVAPPPPRVVERNRLVITLRVDLIELIEPTTEEEEAEEEPEEERTSRRGRRSG